ncbi:cellulase family glycosylhydrolase [Subtercola boreus]|nr:cellulase family glycosylhydrolase [Subtercola boreus]
MQFTRRAALTTGISAGALMGSGVLAGGVAPALASAAPALVAQQAPARIASFPVGYSLGSNILWGTTAEVDQTLDAIANIGGTIVRIDIMWYWVQPTSSTTFDWSRVDYMVAGALARGLSILGIILSSPPWASLGGVKTVSTDRPRTAALYGTFAGAVAKRYKGKIGAYEIWNEPNGREAFTPNPDPAFYAQMVKAAYPAIKKADPAAKVVAGALGPAPTADGLIDPVTFMNGMYAAGAQGFFDAFSFHPYDFDYTLSPSCLWDTTPMRRMIEMHAIMKAKGDGSKKIWLTEYGVPTNLYSQQHVSDMIADTLMTWNEVSYAGPVYIYTVRDGTTDTDSFGAVTNDFQAKTSAYTVQYLQSQGMPGRNEGSVFAGSPDSALGPTVSPVYALGRGYAQECENGTRFLTNNGWFSSPTDVGTLARRFQIVPSTALVNGRQDFDVDGGFAIFTSASTGTHAVYGAILSTYVPSLGLPTTDEYAYQGTTSRAVDFQGGQIVWSPTTGSTLSMKS